MVRRLSVSAPFTKQSVFKRAPLKPIFILLDEALVHLAQGALHPNFIFHPDLLSGEFLCQGFQMFIMSIIPTALGLIENRSAAQPDNLSCINTSL